MQWPQSPGPDRCGDWTRRILGCLFLVVVAEGAPARAADPAATDLVNEYLTLPLEDSGTYGEERAARLRVLRRLWCCPEEAVQAIATVWPELTSSVQRSELLDTLGRLPTERSVTLLVAALDDPEPQVRIAAVGGVRRLASRFERRGVVDVPVEAQFPPRIEGLVPHLVRASHDADVAVRRRALWALADTKEPEAAAEIRRHLEESDDSLRLLAACLLTEFGDDAGLPVLGTALQRVASGEAVPMGEAMVHVEQLLASLARITRDNPGPPPMNPLLSSSMVRAEQLRSEYEDLVAAWALWWVEHAEDR